MPAPEREQAGARQVTDGAALDGDLFELFAGLNERHMRAVASTSRLLDVTRPHPIYTRGDPADHAFLVKAGVMKIATIGPEGREMVLGLAHRGALIGETVLFDAAPRDHSAFAHEDVLVYALDRQLLLGFLR